MPDVQAPGMPLSAAELLELADAMLVERIDGWPWVMCKVEMVVLLDAIREARGLASLDASDLDRLREKTATQTALLTQLYDHIEMLEGQRCFAQPGERPLWRRALGRLRMTAR